MKTYALFLGCTIPARVQPYESATRAVLDKLGVRLVDCRDFACCGYPLRNVDQRAFLHSAARNLALANRLGLEMMVLCKCCFGSLKAAQHILRRDTAARSDVDRRLREQGLRLDVDIEVKHLLSVLYHDIGADTLKEKVTQPLTGRKISAHVGCHALRPSHITQFDDPVSPRIFDGLVEVTGAESIQWDTKLDCCGAPLLGVNDELSMALTRNKLNMASKAGADHLCTACPYCQLQFDTVRQRIMEGNVPSDVVPPLLYPQLLGWSMGIGHKLLGIERNAMDPVAIEAP